MFLDFITANVHNVTVASTAELTFFFRSTYQLRMCHIFLILSFRFTSRTHFFVCISPVNLAKIKDLDLVYFLVYIILLNIL